MTGTVPGGQKAAAANRLLYGQNYYDIIGRKGGEVSKGGGFARDHQLAVTAGAKGGSISRSHPEKILCPFCDRHLLSGAGMSRHIKVKHPIEMVGANRQTWVRWIRGGK